MYGLYYNVLQASIMSDYNNIMTECPTVQVDQKICTGISISIIISISYSLLQIVNWCAMENNKSRSLLLVAYKLTDILFFSFILNWFYNNTCVCVLVSVVTFRSSKNTWVWIVMFGVQLDVFGKLWIPGGGLAFKFQKFWKIMETY